MRIKFSEDPHTWLKSVAVLSVLLGGVATFLWFRQRLPAIGLGFALTGAVALLAVGKLRPRFARSVYRGTTVVGFHLGRVMGGILLGLMFILILTPLGWLLRLFGRDILKIRRDPKASSYWHEVKGGSRTDRMF